MEEADAALLMPFDMSFVGVARFAVAKEVTISANKDENRGAV